jgi:hypothetical protein
LSSEGALTDFFSYFDISGLAIVTFVFDFYEEFVFYYFLDYLASSALTPTLDGF